MIIHESEDAVFADPNSHSRQEYTNEKSPEALLLKRLVWVQVKSYWWPALIFHSYTEFQEFIQDELHTLMKAQLAMAILRQMRKRKNIKVARLLGKSALEIVEVTTRYYDFYSGLPELLPKAIERSLYGKDTELFLDMHKALDQVEIIISEVFEKPFSLLPGMGYTTWLQKARAQVTKRDQLFDKGDCTYFPGLRDQTGGDASINPIAQKRPMSHLIPTTQTPIPSHVQPNDMLSDEDFLLSQYQALSKLAHDADNHSVGSILSTSALAPKRAASGKAVRFSENKSSAPTHSKSNRKKESMPRIQERVAEKRDESGTRGQKEVSESREAPQSMPVMGQKSKEVRRSHKSEQVRLGKIGSGIKKLPVHRLSTAIRRPPMTLAKERNRIAVPTESPDSCKQRVQEFLLHKKLSAVEEEESLHTDSYQTSEDSSSAASTLSEYSNESRSEKRELNSVGASSTGTFDEYLRATEKTLQRLIIKEKERLVAEKRRKQYPTGEQYNGNRHDHQRSRRGRNPDLVQYGAMTKQQKLRNRSHHQKQRQKEEPTGFLSCFPGNEEQDEPSVTTSYSRGESVEILPGLEGDDIVPGLSNKINSLMSNKKFHPHQDYPKTKVPIEILPGLVGDDIAPGLSEKIDELVAVKGYFTQQDVLRMIQELDQDNSDDEESISINHFGELARQRVRNILR